MIEMARVRRMYLGRSDVDHLFRSNRGGSNDWYAGCHLLLLALAGSYGLPLASAGVLRLSPPSRPSQ
jgi:hypothetical protein